MELTNFQFTQGKLQDLVDCRRRFQLRYLDKLAWPAPRAEPALESERRMRLGADFHRLVHQHQVGIAPERLARSIDDPELRRWWEAYLRDGPAELPGFRRPEHVLSAPLGGHRLLAKYDLLSVEPGERAVIVDWKTSRKKPPRDWLAGRLQTRVYRCLLVEAGAHLNGGGKIAPERVEMVYWFAEEPKTPERFAYSREEYEADRAYLLTLIQKLERSSPNDFPKTDDVRHCHFCPYRSYCDRGVEAGPLSEAEHEEFELDLEEIEEIALR